MLPRSIKNGYRKKLELILLISIILSTIIYSCKKTETIAEPVQQVNFSEKFFALKGGESSLVLDIIKNLKVQNERTHFVDNLPTDCGLPMWNKLKLISNKNKNKDITARVVSNTANTQGTTDTVFIIPLTITNTAISSLLTLVPDSTIGYIINCLTTNSYLYNLCHGTIVNQSFTENQLAMFFSLEYETFGRTKFYNIPSNIFSHQGNPFGTRTVSIDTIIVGNFIQTTCIILTHCTQTGSCEGGICDQCNWCTEPLCWTYGEPGGGGGGGSGGSGGGSGGSGGSGGGSSGGSGGGGSSSGGGSGGSTNNCPWYGCPVALLDQDPVSPITDSIPNILSRACNNQIDSLFSWGLVNGNREQSFILVRKNGIIYPKNYKLGTSNGDKTSVNYTLAPDEELVGYAHTHPAENDYTQNSFFTFNDIQEARKKAIIPKYTALLECGNKRFALIIDDPNKLNAFINLSRLQELKRLKLDSLTFSPSNAAVYSISPQQANIIAVISYFGSSATCGISFYAANSPNKSNFTKLNP